MISGIVYFEEVLSEVKRLTGISALEPYYPGIRASIKKTESEIGGGGFVIRRNRRYTLGSSDYDGKILKFPYDMMGEYSLIPMNTGIFRGEYLELFEEFQDAETIDFSYMGLLADSKGDPITTRNHLDAVVKGAIHNLYSPIAFLGTGGRGSLNQLSYYRNEWNDAIGAARGNDAFPDDSQWESLGYIMRRPFSSAMYDYCILETEEDRGRESSLTIPTGCDDPGELTVDMVAVYEAAKLD